MANLPTDSKERKNVPLATGVLDYFPDALAAIAHVSKLGNDKHNPGEPLHWARGKSDDHADALMRHLIDRGHFDSEGIRHSAAMAWRALAILQLEIEKDQSWADAAVNNTILGQYPEIVAVEIPKKTYAELEKENEDLRREVAVLETYVPRVKNISMECKIDRDIWGLAGMMKSG